MRSEERGDYMIVRRERPPVKAKSPGVQREFLKWSELLKGLKAAEAIEYYGKRTAAYFHTVAVRGGWVIQTAKTPEGHILVWRVP